MCLIGLRVYDRGYVGPIHALVELAQKKGHWQVRDTVFSSDIGFAAIQGRHVRAHLQFSDGVEIEIGEVIMKVHTDNMVLLEAALVREIHRFVRSGGVIK